MRFYSSESTGDNEGLNNSIQVDNLVSIDEKLPVIEERNLCLRKND